MKFIGEVGQYDPPSTFKAVNSCTLLYCQQTTVSSSSGISLSLSLKVGYGSWFEHVQEFWEHRMDSNVLFLKYEDMYKVTSSQSLVLFLATVC